MWRETHASRIGVGQLGLDRLYRTCRSIQVRVVEGTREADAFHASSPEVLRAALRPIYRYLDTHREKLQFTGVEERWLPLGIGRTREEVGLGGLESALAFLGDK